MLRGKKKKDKSLNLGGVEDRCGSISMILFDANNVFYIIIDNIVSVAMM